MPGTGANGGLRKASAPPYVLGLGGTGAWQAEMGLNQAAAEAFQAAIASAWSG